MQGVWTWIKAHPLLTAGLVLGLFVLVYLIFRGRGRATEGGGLIIQGPSDAAIQAGIMSQQIGAAQSAQSSSEQTMLQALREQISGTLAIETLKAQTSLIGQETAITGQITLEQQRLSTEESIGLAQISAVTAGQQLAAEAAISQAALAATTATTLAQITTMGATAQSYISADLQKSLSVTQSATYLELAKIQSVTQMHAAEVAASAQKSSSIWGTIGTIATGALLAFSDAREKEDIQPATDLGDGFRLFSFRRKGRAERQIGFVAQDLERSHPAAVPIINGVRAVDYAKIANIAYNHSYMMQGGYAA
jgi:hypothetical protein